MAAPRFSSAGNSMEGNVSENGYSDPPQQQQGGYYGGQNSAAQQNQQNAGYYQQTDKDYPQQQTINPGYNQGYNQNDYGPDHGNFQGNFQGFGQEKKKSTTRDCIDMMCTHVNYDLLIAKTFYFFFFASFGSLFPLISIYFKQLGMNPTQCGLLIGFRPFIEIASAPVWGSFAEKFKKGKQILLFSLFCWIAFTVAIAFITPAPHSCMYSNSTHKFLEEPYVDRQRRELPPGVSTDDFSILDNVPFLSRTLKEFRYNMAPRQHAPRTSSDMGKAPYYVDHNEIANYGEQDAKGLVSPPYSAVVYREVDVQSAFLLILLTIVINEFFASPAITLADSVVLGYLGDDVENYGRQRMFGSIGWGLAMFFVGVALDHSDVFPNHPCAITDYHEKNYTVCFAVFSVLMSCALIAATQFRFKYADSQESIPLNLLKDQVVNNVKKRVFRKPVVERYKKLDEDQDYDDNFPVQKEAEREYESMEKQDMEKRIEITVQNQQQQPDMVSDATKNQPPGASAQVKPKWREVLMLFASVRASSVLFVAWFMGFGIGLVFTFLFWHLQDMGGSPTLFGIASVINHISEIFAHIFGFKLIQSLGHIKLLYIGLLGNVARFLYISWLQNPWWVLPFEFIQGLTHAAVWTACCSYLSQSAPQHMRSSVQGVLQGVHHALGRGLGAIIGGAFVRAFGSSMTFRGYGFACLVVLIVFFCVTFFLKDHSQTNLLDSDQPCEILEETSTLAPCGVPMNPMSRNLSSTRLDQLGQQGGQQNGYGTTQDGFLHPSGGMGGGGGGGGGDVGGGMGGGDGGGYNQHHHQQQGYGRTGRQQDRLNNNPVSDMMLSLSHKLAAAGGNQQQHANADIDLLIKNNFQAYSEVLSLNKDLAFNGNVKLQNRALLLRNTPVLATAPHLLQPAAMGTQMVSDDDDEEGEWF